MARTDQIVQGKSKPICLIVLGCHRSGTSALTRLLNIHGCDLPATLMMASPGNEQGHWESLAIAEFDDELLESAGSQWDDVQPFNEGWYSSLRHGGFRERAKSLLMAEFGQSPLFVLKDPRICRIAPFWLNVVDDCGFEPAIVLPIRDPHEVADSLERRDERPNWYGHLLWLRHVLDAEYATRGYRRVFSSYAGIRLDWRAQMEKIRQALGLEWPRVSSIAASEADQFIRPGKAGDVATAVAPDLTRRPEVLSWMNDTFAIFDKWVRHGEVEDDRLMLDSIRMEFDQATFALSAFLLPHNAEGGAEQGVRRRMALQEELAARDAALSSVESDLAATKRQIEQLSAEHERVQDDMSVRLAEREAELAKIADELAAARHRAVAAEEASEDLARQLSSRNAERDHAAGEIDALREKTASYEREIDTHWKDTSLRIDALEGKIAAQDDLLRAREHLIGEYLREMHQLKDAHMRAAKLEDELEKLRQERLAMERENDGLIAKVSDLVDDRAESSGRMTGLEEKLASKESQLRRLEQVNGDLVAEIRSLRRARNQIDKLEASLANADARIGRLTADRRTALTEAARLRSAASELELRIGILSGEPARAGEPEGAGRTADRVRIEALRSEAANAQQFKVNAQREIKARFEEIAKLSALLSESEADSTDKQWLQATYSILIKMPAWWRFVPTKMRRRHEHGLLREAGLFDAAAYVARYPDVAAKGVDPLRHYIMHGIKERRDRSFGR